MIPSVDQLLAFARTVEGDALTTLHRGRPFKVAVVGSNLEITSSNDKPRTTDRSHIGELLEKLSKTGSFQPTQYRDVTFNASYLLALVRMWQGSHP